MNHLKYLVANHSPFTASDKYKCAQRAKPKEQTVRWILIGTMNRCVRRKRDTAENTKAYRTKAKTNKQL